MWLPKDERKLLSLYYKKIGEPRRSQLINESDLINTLSPKCGAKGSKGVPQYAKCKLRLSTANRILSEREFIEYREAGEAVDLSLSIKGYDLGRKYYSWWSRSGEWFKEYKDHWIWLIVGFVGGVIGALLVNWLSG